MSYKPDKSTLVAYLYNELNAEERARVETYLKVHPEVEKELNEITEMRKIMGKWEDKEAVEPTFVFDDKKVVVMSDNNWFTGVLKTSIGIAASIAFLMMVAYFTNFSVTKNDDGIQLSFGNKEVIKEDETSPLTEENIKAWLDESVASNNAQLVNKINEVENNLSSELTNFQQANSKAIQSAMPNNSIDESILQEYLVQLKDENKEILFNMMTATESAQRQYVNEILADYSLYLEEQRQKDLQMIQTSFNNLKDNTEVNQIETSEILASIITTVNNQNN